MPDGRSLGRLAPHNYTEDVWVSLDDRQAIEDRFNEFKNQFERAIPQFVGDIGDKMVENVSVYASRKNRWRD